MSIILLSLILLFSQQETVTATHYGYPEYFNGRTMSCGAIYDSSDPTILAVSISRNAVWPCGTSLRVSGPAGTISVVRTDTCGGCHYNMIDLSDQGSIEVCGNPAHTCQVTVTKN